MKARFITDLYVKPVRGSERLWQLDSPLQYMAGVAHGGPQIICIPGGFITDFASIPRVFWRVFLPSGMHREAAVLHDWLYFIGDRHRVVADAIFLEAMTVLGVKPWKRIVMFCAVLCFGWIAWRKHRKAGGAKE